MTADPLPNSHLELGRNASSIHCGLQTRSKPDARIDLRGTGRAILDVPQDFVIRLDKEFVIDVRVQVFADFLAGALSKLNAVHALLPSSEARAWEARAWEARPIPYDCARSASFARSNFLPRLTRDITVPTGTFSIPAASLYENSSTSMSSTTARKSCGTSVRAASICSSVICSGRGAPPAA